MGLFFEFNTHLSASTKIEYGQDVIYKTNPPVSEEEITIAREYDAEQKRIAAANEARRLASLRKSQPQNLATGVGKYPCNCVLWAQANGLGISGYGAARNYPVNSKIPAATGFVVTYESSPGHIAKYTLVGEYLLLQEANYYRCQITTNRLLPVNSTLIKGYIN